MGRANLSNSRIVSTIPGGSCVILSGEFALDFLDADSLAVGTSPQQLSLPLDLGVLGAFMPERCGYRFCGDFIIRAAATPCGGVKLTLAQNLAHLLASSSRAIRHF
jgi:hypothetical protein